MSGPVDVIDEFVEKLKEEGIFAKKVNSSNVAFHSKYIADAAPKLRSNLERVSYFVMFGFVRSVRIFYYYYLKKIVNFPDNSCGKTT